MTTDSRRSGARGPRVSVVLPSYNHAAFIDAAIGSVLAQTYAELELVIVDDGSTDSSSDRILCFDDARIVTEFQENQGAHAAINRGIELASPSSEYIAILNSDDEYAPRWLERCIALLDADPELGFCAGGLEFLGDSDGDKQGWHADALAYWRRVDDVTRALSYRNFIMTTSNVVMRRSVLRQVGGFRPLRYVHDLDMFLRLASVSRFQFIDEPLVRYRIHGSNTIAECGSSRRLEYEFAWILVERIWREYSTSHGPEQLFRRVLDLAREVEHPEVARAALALFPLRAALDRSRASDAEVESFALELLDEDSPFLACMNAGEPGVMEQRMTQMRMHIGKLEYDLADEGERYERRIADLRARLEELQGSGRYRLGQAIDEARDLRGLVRLPGRFLDIVRRSETRPGPASAEGASGPDEG